jgi:protein O-mannosyl-transferase
MNQPRPVVVGAVIAVLAAVVFLPAITGPWIYDDRLLIADNPYVHSFEWWPRWFVTDFWNIGEDALHFGSRMVYWRPAISGSYALDWKVGGGAPLLFHITNTLTHAAVGALSFVVLRRWIGAVLPAAAAALLFAVHPTKAESVAWIAGRTDIYCMIAVLLACQGIARRVANKPGGLVLEALATLAAYTCKEQAIVLPAFAAVEAWVAQGRPALDVPVILRGLRAALPQTLIAVGYLVLRSVVLPIKSGAAGLPLFDHVQAVAESMGRFIVLTVAPHSLSVQQGLVQTSAGVPQHSLVYVIVGAISLIGLTVLAFVLRRRQPAITISIALYLVTLAPTLNIVYTNMLTLISERFLYLPLFGVALGVGWALATWPANRVLQAAVGVFIAFTSIQSLRRAADYRDEDAFWSRELELHPESAEARRARVRKLIRERRYRPALAETLELTRKATDYQDVQVAVEMAQLLSDLTPDRDRASLEAIDHFTGELLQPTGDTATLAVGGATFTIPTTTRLFKQFRDQHHLRIIMLRASLRSRLGDDAGSVELAKDALTECPRCANMVGPGALVLGRAGFYDDAYRLLDSVRGYVPDAPLEGIRTMLDKAVASRHAAEAASGPAALQAKASELAALELWGRAYDVLSPYRDQIKQAPKFAQGFAELAFRAGDPDAARDVLSASMTSQQIDALIADWSARMGWVD